MNFNTIKFKLSHLSLKQKLLIGALSFLVLILPLLLIFTQKQQDIRQRASGEDTIMNISPDTITKGIGETFDVQFLINTTTFNVSAFDLVIQFTPETLQIDSLQPSTIFGTPILPALPFNPTAANQSGSLRYVASNNTASTVTGNAIQIVTITFRGKAEGQATIGFTRANVTASGQQDFLTTDKTKTATITITQTSSTTPTSTIAPSATTIPSLAPSPTLNPAGISGAIENIDCKTINGWAINSKLPTSPVNIWIYADGPENGGIFSGNTDANIPRSDNTFGFSATIIDPLKDGKPHAIYVYGQDKTASTQVLVPLTNSPIMMTCHPTATNTPAPTIPLATNTPAATPTTDPNSVILSLALSLQGIGDKSLISVYNPTPINPTRQFTVCLYPASIDPSLDPTCVQQGVIKKVGNLTYDNSASGSATFRKFVSSSFAIGSNSTIPNGVYQLLVKTDKYLRTQSPTSLIVSNPGSIAIPVIFSRSFIVGDINGDNSVDTLDWNILNDCGAYSGPRPPSMASSTAKDPFGSPVCQAHTSQGPLDTNQAKLNADLNDDGFVNQNDLQLFIFSLSTIQGK